MMTLWRTGDKPLRLSVSMSQIEIEFMDILLDGKHPNLK